MNKGFGIAALVLAILAIFVPVAGIVLSGLALLLAAVAALAGDRAFAIATPLIAGVNTFLLSPSVWMALKGSEQGGGQTGMVIVILAFLAAPFVAIALNASGKIVLDRKVSG